MNDPSEDVVSLFAKNASEAIGVAISEWQGQPRLDVRTYVPVLGQDHLVPTKKGISLRLDQYPELLDAVRRLGDVMGKERLVARISKSIHTEVRVGVTMYKGHSLIYVRTYVRPDPDTSEWQPTQKGISLRVDLYPQLLEAIEAVGTALSST